MATASSASSAYAEYTVMKALHLVGGGSANTPIEIWERS